MKLIFGMRIKWTGFKCLRYREFISLWLAIVYEHPVSIGSLSWRTVRSLPTYAVKGAAPDDAIGHRASRRCTFSNFLTTLGLPLGSNQTTWYIITITCTAIVPQPGIADFLISGVPVLIGFNSRRSKQSHKKRRFNVIGFLNRGAIPWEGWPMALYGSAAINVKRAYRDVNTTM